LRVGAAFPTSNDDRRRDRAQISRAIEAAREHIDEPFLPQRERRRFDIERCDRDEVSVERRAGV